MNNYAAGTRHKEPDVYAYHDALSIERLRDGPARICFLRSAPARGPISPCADTSGHGSIRSTFHEAPSQHLVTELDELIVEDFVDPVELSTGKP